AAPVRFRRLRADRGGDADWARGEERNPHRRVREVPPRGRRRAGPCRARGGAGAAPADPDDVVRVHFWLPAALDRYWRRRRSAAHPRNRGHQRHLDADADSHLRLPDAVRRHRAALRASAAAPGRADPVARSVRILSSDMRATTLAAATAVLAVL